MSSGTCEATLTERLSELEAAYVRLDARLQEADGWIASSLRLGQGVYLALVELAASQGLGVELRCDGPEGRPVVKLSPLRRGPVQ